MKPGDIVLIPFPFSELSRVKVRPAVVAYITKDRYQDIVLCAVSSVIPDQHSANSFVVQPGGKNTLRVPSVVKVDRIVTLKSQNIIAQLGSLSQPQLTDFKHKFKALVD